MTQPATDAGVAVSAYACVDCLVGAGADPVTASVLAVLLGVVVRTALDELRAWRARRRAAQDQSP